MDGVNIGNLVDLKEHGLQTATKALKDGAGRISNFCGIFSFEIIIRLVAKPGIAREFVLVNLAMSDFV